jgi:hypothetical protein
VLEPTAGRVNSNRLDQQMPRCPLVDEHRTAALRVGRPNSACGLWLSAEVHFNEHDSGQELLGESRWRRDVPETSGAIDPVGACHRAMTVQNDAAVVPFPSFRDQCADQFLSDPPPALIRPHIHSLQLDRVVAMRTERRAAGRMSLLSRQ